MSYKVQKSIGASITYAKPSLLEQPPSSSIKAVGYVRMSTEHQQYSTTNQADKILEYANKRGIEILRNYADEGRSGLNIKGRPGLQELIKLVESGKADFQIILVYDISRWGRFQDADESAYYEYICRRNGVQIIYCAEQFDNDGSPVSAIVKSVKRVMAGEYSRELSTKVFTGQCRLIELGYRQGGPAGYGLRRVLIDQNGNMKGALTRGEHKNLQTDRVILIPGPDEEIKIVNRIYDWFIDEELNEFAIAKRLNELGLKTDLNRPWNRKTVHQILTNEKYIGNNVYNRISYKLKKARVINLPNMWIKKESAFTPIVAVDKFYAARQIILTRRKRFDKDELISKLRALYKNKGYLTKQAINEADGMPSSTAYKNRFGTLINAYEKVGFKPSRDYQHLETNRYLRQIYPEIIHKTEQKIHEVGGLTSRDNITEIITVNNEFTISIVLARCKLIDGRSPRWKIRFDARIVPDITLAIRLNKDNTAPLDYYLFPRLDFQFSFLCLTKQSAMKYECYRFDDLEFLYGMANRANIRR